MQIVWNIKYFLEINLSRLGLTFGQFKESNSNAKAAVFCLFCFISEQEAPGSPYSCAEGYKLYKIGTQGVHVRQAI